MIEKIEIEKCELIALLDRIFLVSDDKDLILRARQILHSNFKGGANTIDNASNPRQAEKDWHDHLRENIFPNNK